MNLSIELWELRASMIIGIYQPVEEYQIEGIEWQYSESLLIFTLLCVYVLFNVIIQ